MLMFLIPLLYCLFIYLFIFIFNATFIEMKVYLVIFIIIYCRLIDTVTTIALHKIRYLLSIFIFL